MKKSITVGNRWIASQMHINRLYAAIEGVDSIMFAGDHCLLPSLVACFSLLLTATFLGCSSHLEQVCFQLRNGYITELHLRNFPSLRAVLPQALKSKYARAQVMPGVSRYTELCVLLYGACVHIDRRNMPSHTYCSLSEAVAHRTCTSPRQTGATSLTGGNRHGCCNLQRRCRC